MVQWHFRHRQNINGSVVDNSKAIQDNYTKQAQDALNAAKNSTPAINRRTAQNVVSLVDSQFAKLSYNSTDTVKLAWDETAKHGHVTTVGSDGTLKSMSSGMTKAEYDVAKAYYDKNGDSSISKNEWINGPISLRQALGNISISDKTTTIQDLYQKQSQNALSGAKNQYNGK